MGDLRTHGELLGDYQKNVQNTINELLTLHENYEQIKRQLRQYEEQIQLQTQIAKEAINFLITNGGGLEGIFIPPGIGLDEYRQCRSCWGEAPVDKKDV